MSLDLLQDVLAGGWLDLVALKYVYELNGVTQLCITKLDVLEAKSAKYLHCLQNKGWSDLCIL